MNLRLCAVLTAAMLCFQSVFAMKITYDGKTHEYTANPVRLVVNNIEVLDLEMPPIILNNSTLVPAREVFEKLGAVVTWASGTKEIFVSYGNDLLIMKIDSNIARINDKIIEIDVLPKIINDKTMIPARYAAELLGFNVDWDSNTRTVYIDNYKTIHPNETQGAEQLTPPVSSILDPSLTPLNENASPKTGTSLYNASSDVSINSIKIPSWDSQNTFTINATGTMGDVMWQTFDNKLVVDISQTTMNVSSANLSVTDNSDVLAVRTSQFETTPIKKSRIVFDLRHDAPYQINVSSDRKAVSVTFLQNTINAVTLKSVSGIDTVEISGEYGARPVISVLSNPDRIVIDIPNSTLGTLDTSTLTGNFIKTARAGQFMPYVTRVVLETNGQCSFNYAVSGYSTLVNVYEPTHKNIAYSNHGEPVLTLSKQNTQLDISRFVSEDKYTNYEYSISLNGDYNKHFGYGDYYIHDGNIKYVAIETVNGNTKLTFHANKVFAYVITEDANTIYIKAVNPKQVYNKIIVIDPGHGGTDPGAMYGTLSEKTLALDMALKLQSILQEDKNIKVYMTRNDDTYPSWDDRTYKWEGIADILVAIHCNANVSENPNGTEVLYTNRENGLNNITNKQIAEIFQKNLVETLGTFDRGVSDRPKLIVINRATTYPVAYLEVAFLTNEADRSKLTDEQTRLNVAYSAYKSIMEFFALKGNNR